MNLREDLVEEGWISPKLGNEVSINPEVKVTLWEVKFAAWEVKVMTDILVTALEVKAMTEVSVTAEVKATAEVEVDTTEANFTTDEEDF